MIKAKQCREKWTNMIDDSDFRYIVEMFFVVVLIELLGNIFCKTIKKLRYMTKMSHQWIWLTLQGWYFGIIITFRLVDLKVTEYSKIPLQKVSENKFWLTRFFWIKSFRFITSFQLKAHFEADGKNKTLQRFTQKN